MIAVAVVVFAEPLADLIGLDDPDAASSLRALAITLPFATWNTITLAGTRAFGRMRTTVMVDKIGRPLAQPLLVLLVVPRRRRPARPDPRMGRPLRRRRLVAGWLFRRLPRPPRHDAAHRADQELQQLRREFWQFTWPRSITRISQMAIQRMDIILVAALRSPTRPRSTPPQPVSWRWASSAPRRSSRCSSRSSRPCSPTTSTERLKDVYQISAAWSMAVAWPMYVGVASAPLVYLGLFGQEYVDDGLAVVLLMAGAQLFAVATGPCDTLLLMSGRSTLSLANSLTALALDMGLCLLLIPQMGITGAALAWAIAVTTRCILALIQVRVTMKILSFGPAAAGGRPGQPRLASRCRSLVVELFVDLNIVTLLVVLAVLLPALRALPVVRTAGPDARRAAGTDQRRPRGRHRVRRRGRTSRSSPMRRRTVMFESWRGLYSDSPRALSERLAATDLPLRRLWVTTGENEFPADVVDRAAAQRGVLPLAADAPTCWSPTTSSPSTWSRAPGCTTCRCGTARR